MSGQRGLAQGTVSHRCSEAGRLLDWLGKQATREELTALTHLDVDRYMKHRAGSVGRRSLKDVTAKIRSFLRWLHITGQPRSFIHRNRTTTLRVRKYSIRSSSRGRGESSGCDATRLRVERDT
jgi:site-specific recombinase XerD